MKRAPRLPAALAWVSLAAVALTAPRSAWGDGHEPEPAPVRLTEAAVAEAAANASPGVIAARRDADAAEAERVAAERARLPDVTLSARYTRLSPLPARYRTLSLPAPDGAGASFVLPQLLDGYAARAALSIPLSDAWLGLAAAAAAAGEVATARRIEVEATRARAAFEGRAAFLQFRRAWVARRAAATALDSADSQARDQRERVRAGTAAPSSALTFEAAHHVALARLHAAEAEVAATEAAIRPFLAPPAATAALEPVDDDAPPVANGAPGLAAPALRAARATATAAEARERAETYALLPRLSLVAGIDVTAPSPRAFAVSRLVGVPAWDVTVQLEWSLSALTAGVARRERAAAERDAWWARAEEVRRQLTAQRAAAEAARRSATARLANAAAGLVTAAQLAEARRAELAAGLATPLDATLAESERVRAELERADAELDLRLAQARLDFASGLAPTRNPRRAGSQER
ncbi:MAG: TolC family protein [Gemmatimonadaceae bacterium]|nr:TolC family protein [Gemmatimonadaceae bacterium]MCU0685201.1 TolC family protein [Polyangiaceae bacterium]